MRHVWNTTATLLKHLWNTFGTSGVGLKSGTGYGTRKNRLETGGVGVGTRSVGFGTRSVDVVNLEFRLTNSGRHF